MPEINLSNEVMPSVKPTSAACPMNSRPWAMFSLTYAADLPHFGNNLIKHIRRGVDNLLNLLLAVSTQLLNTVGKGLPLSAAHHSGIIPFILSCSDAHVRAERSSQPQQSCPCKLRQQAEPIGRCTSCHHSGGNWLDRADELGRILKPTHSTATGIDIKHNVLNRRVLKALMSGESPDSPSCPNSFQKPESLLSDP